MDALIVVDMLEDFVNPNGALYVQGAENIVANINDLIRIFSKQDIIIFANDAHSDDDPEFSKFPRHAVKDSVGAMVYVGIKFPNKYETIEKLTFDPFTNEKMEKTLKQYNIETVYICGVVTEICVKVTAASALANGYTTVVIEDAIKEINASHGEKALDKLRESGAIVIFYK